MVEYVVYSRLHVFKYCGITMNWSPEGSKLLQTDISQITQMTFQVTGESLCYDHTTQTLYVGQDLRPREDSWLHKKKD